MKKFIGKRDNEVNVIDFEEFLEGVKESGFETENEKEQNVEYKGYNVTRDSDSRYMLAKDGEVIHSMTDKKVLIEEEDGTVWTLKEELFKQLFYSVE